jgi:hypothetical protein
MLGRNRVELLVDAATIGPAVRRFDDVLGFGLSAPQEVPGHALLSSVDFQAGLEPVAPTSDASPAARPPIGATREPR